MHPAISSCMNDINPVCHIVVLHLLACHFAANWSNYSRNYLSRTYIHRILDISKMSKLFQTFAFLILFTHSNGEHNLFTDEGDLPENEVEKSFPGVEKLFTPQKSGRDNNEADLEVILNSGPMIAPDIIITQLVDSKMTVDKMMEEIYSQEKKNSGEEEDETQLDILRDHPSTAENEIENSDRFMENGNKLLISENSPPKSASNDLKIFSGNEPCRMKFNGTSGHFSLNFTQDCLILVTTPQKKSTVVLNCTPIVLANCSVNRDTLTVNLKGDLRFGRNSYIYCGANAQVRATSLRRRISIKIRKADIMHTTECSFHTRKRRELDEGIGSSSNIGLPIPSCGRLGRVSKIVGGRRVSPGLFPWVAQLDITRVDGSQTACTGSIVSPHYILTAAHCLKNAESISVFMGGTDRHEFTGSEIIVQAEKYILHRKWSPRTLAADIALVKLTDGVKFTEDVSPICLPKGKLLHETFDGRKGVAVGWGRVESKKKAPRQLYRVRLPFLDENSCQRHYRRFFVPKLMVCTDSSVDAAICYGDSGGPLMYKRKDRVFQVGVASFSLSKVCGASPDVFTHVREYVPWIEGRIRQESEE